MNKETLDKDTFAAVAELSKIQTNISKGRVSMSELKENEAAYLAQREEKAEKGIKEVFTKSKKIITEIGKNFSQLRAWHNEIAGFVGELVNMSQGLLKLKESMTEYLEAENKKLEERTIELSEVEAALKAQAVDLDTARGSFDKEKEALSEAARKVADDRGTLDRAWREVRGEKRNI